jgi:hypothetical protein
MAVSGVCSVEGEGAREGERHGGRATAGATAAVAILRTESGWVEKWRRRSTI